MVEFRTAEWPVPINLFLRSPGCVVVVQQNGPIQGGITGEHLVRNGDRRSVAPVSGSVCFISV